jgi:hypothetical protein
LNPQVPGQGSLHFNDKQDLSKAQSELMVHSGRQFGGLPMYDDKQEQTATLFIFRHCEFGPQGEGWQGSVIGSSLITLRKKKSLQKLIRN